MYPQQDICHHCGEWANVVSTVSAYREKVAGKARTTRSRGISGPVGTVTAFRQKVATEPTRRGVVATMASLFPSRPRLFPVFGTMSEMLTA